MHRSTTGNYRTITTLGETVRAFIPAPLPPTPHLDIDGARQRLLERATLALGRLDSVGMLLPDPHLFLYSYVRREAVLSSQIEGTQSSLSDLLLFELEHAPGTPVDDVLEVSAYVAALHHGMERLEQGFPLSRRLLCEMHGILMQRGRGSDKLPGEFRRSQNWIGGTRPGNAHFVPPPADDVAECMSAMEKFIHDDGHAIPALIKAALVHVQFETIHPFLDGNGRLGRLLIGLMLVNAGVLREPTLYVSLHFKLHRSRYYELLDSVRTAGDWESWIDFFLEGVESSATDAVTTALRLSDLFSADAVRVRSSGRGSATALRVHQALCNRPILTLSSVCNNENMAFPTAARAMQTLMDLGIVRELTGMRSRRVFAYSAYLDLLSQGGEPL